MYGIWKGYSVVESYVCRGPLPFQHTLYVHLVALPLAETVGTVLCANKLGAPVGDAPRYVPLMGSHLGSLDLGDIGP